MQVVASQMRLPFQGGHFHLVYCNPPYQHRLEEHEFQAFTGLWIREAVRMLALDSRLVVCCNAPLRSYYERSLCDYLGQIDSEVIWHYDFGIYRNKNWVPSHDNLLIWKRGNPPFFWEEVAIESQRLNKGDPRADIRGRTPGTVWNFPRVPGNSRERHYAGKRRSGVSQQPEALCKRILRAYTNKTDRVLDMFCGGGTMAASCFHLGRTCFSIDLREWICKDAQDRINFRIEEIFLGE